MALEKKDFGMIGGDIAHCCVRTGSAPTVKRNDLVTAMNQVGSSGPQTALDALETDRLLNNLPKNSNGKTPRGVS